MSTDHLQSSLILFALIKQDNFEYIQLFQLIIRQLNPTPEEIIPDSLDDPKRSDFLPSHSWLLCLSEEINQIYPNLSEHLINYQQQWKEYLFSTIKLDFLNLNLHSNEQQHFISLEIRMRKPKQDRERCTREESKKTNVDGQQRNK